MKRIRRQRAFLHDVLAEANRHRRTATLQHANSDQVNALSELALNLLRKHIPIQQKTKMTLQRHAHAIRQAARRRDSVKKRRAIFLKQKGSGFWRGFKECFEACHQQKRR